MLHSHHHNGDDVASPVSLWGLSPGQRWWSQGLLHHNTRWTSALEKHVILKMTMTEDDCHIHIDNDNAEVKNSSLAIHDEHLHWQNMSSHWRWLPCHGDRKRSYWICKDWINVFLGTSEWIIKYWRSIFMLRNGFISREIRDAANPALHLPNEFCLLYSISLTNRWHWSIWVNKKHHKCQAIAIVKCC